MRINLNHCHAVSIPRRGCLYRKSEDESLIRGDVSSIRLRHFINKFLASSLLIFSAGIFAAKASDIFNLTGGKMPASIIKRPVRFNPFFVGSQLPCVQRSKAMLEPKVAFRICEYTSAYDHPPPGGVSVKRSSVMVSSLAR